MDANHAGDDFFWSSGKANAPASHGISFGETAHQNGAFLHTGQAGETNMLGAVNKTIVDLIRNDHQVMLLDQGS